MRNATVSIIPYRTCERCLLAVNQFVIRQILLGFESLAAVLAGESRRRGVSLEVTTQEPLDEEALAAMQARVIVCGGLLMMLQRF